MLIFMLVPSIPSNEAERLQDLLSARILDTPIQEGFERITRIAKDLFKVPIVTISLVDDRRQWFKSVQGLDIFETPREVSFCGHTILQDDFFIVSDTHLDSRFCDNPLVVHEPYIRFYAGYPILSPKGYKYGAICLIDRFPREMTGEELAPLKDLAALVETEILKHSSYYAQEKLIHQLDQAKLVSMVDPLTRLWNRTGMMNILCNKMEEYDQNKQPFGIALLDIDHFKYINDAFGHDVGDNVLKSLAKILIRSCRDIDAASRWGGEEFLILINDSFKGGVPSFAERIRKKIQKQGFLYVHKSSLKLTVTIGTTAISSDNSLDINALIKQADQALYVGKNTGRNKVVGFQH